ncbi:Salicylate hydroxylase [Tolypocladium ophioglossoides CBS 100239]|uniref:Salicylate hydroxylase n=1 Tax=Tolypocladium ophioglossoides (strain CBS 100239) TaxID=1163406 RepID=A0A0L0N339_TOLOC|nr:Salicylate hydroxylase [Tolypocladium ophioglossoides CBS 100239]
MDTSNSPTEPLEVVIVGGGIIGLVLTVGLLRVGVKVKVYEQAQGFREIGAGIAFTANAIRCMSLIDPAIPTALRSSGSVATSNGGEEDPNDYLRWIDGYDRQREDEPYQQRLLYKLDAGYKGFEGCRRDQFLEALVKIVPPGVIELRKRLETIEDRGKDKKLLLKFRDGTTTEADAGELMWEEVIGCDGVKSRVRQVLLGEDHAASHPRYTHCVAYRTLIPMAKAIEALGPYKAMNQHNHVGPNANLLHYPVANNTMINAVAFVRDPNEWPDDKQTVAQGTRDDVKAAFPGWCPAVQDLIDRFPDTLSKWAIFDLWDYPVPRYNGGRLCLAGDAAHATSPHHGAGACVGVEDALCLSTLMQEVVTETRGNPEVKEQALRAAFTTYDAIRRTRSQWVVNSSRRVCNLHQQREWADSSKLVRAETCFEEIKDRSLKIWHFNYDAMLNETRQGYKQKRAPSNGFVKNMTVY